MFLSIYISIRGEVESQRASSSRDRRPVQQTNRPTTSDSNQFSNFRYRKLICYVYLKRDLLMIRSVRWCVLSFDGFLKGRKVTLALSYLCFLGSHAKKCRKCSNAMLIIYRVFIKNCVFP